MTEVLSKADESMYEQKKRAHIREAERRLHEKQVGGGDIPPEALEYDSLRLYNALVKSTDSYVFVSNMKTGNIPLLAVDRWRSSASRSPSWKMPPPSGEARSTRTTRRLHGGQSGHR